MKKTVAVGVSGGVDSAVCAAMLLEQGFDVTGVYLDNGGDSARAQEVCASLKIPFVKIDARAELESLVIKPFVESYLKCQTPNPCVICNPMVKYPMLIKAADEAGANFVATGHYAGVIEIDGVYYLKKGHPERDQSYMLYRLPQSVLSRCIYPIGDMPKSEVRARASALGLTVADAPDSMEICFIPDDDYAAFIRSRGGVMPDGDIVDTDGNVLGRHKGLYNYTVGQRRGLGVSSSGRLFVTALNAEKNQVILGDNSQLYKDEIKLRDIVWSGRGELCSPEGAVDVKLRHSRVAYKATVSGDTVRFAEKVNAAATPGQSAVFYRDDLVLGGGIIC